MNNSNVEQEEGSRLMNLDEIVLSILTKSSRKYVILVDETFNISKKVVQQV